VCGAGLSARCRLAGVPGAPGVGVGGRIATASVMRSGCSPAAVIAARTVAADGAWYSQKQVSSSGR